MQGGIYSNEAKLRTQKNGKPHGLPFVNFMTWGSIAPKFVSRPCVSRREHFTTQKQKIKLMF